MSHEAFCSVLQLCLTKECYCTEYCKIPPFISVPAWGWRAAAPPPESDKGLFFGRALNVSDRSQQPKMKNNIY